MNQIPTPMSPMSPMPMTPMTPTTSILPGAAVTFLNQPMVPSNPFFPVPMNGAGAGMPVQGHPQLQLPMLELGLLSTLSALSY